MQRSIFWDADTRYDLMRALGSPLVIEPNRHDPNALERRVRAHDGDILFQALRMPEGAAVGKESTAT